MKKILLIFAAICAFAACNPTHESISNDGHITADELKAKSSVTVNIAPDGKTGNVVTCTTSAPVNAKWTIAGKDMVGNYATKKMKLGAHNIVLTGLCADGTVVTAEFPVVCEETTDPLQRFYNVRKPLTRSRDSISMVRILLPSHHSSLLLGMLLACASVIMKVNS